MISGRRFAISVSGALLTACLAVSCTKESDKAKLIASLGDTANGGIFYYVGTVNTDLTPNCGTATPVTTTNTGTTGSGTTTTTTNDFDISSYYSLQSNSYVTSDATMTLRYTYTKSKTRYALTPSTTTVTQCQTIDHITCNSSGTSTCDTVDGVKCGGTKTFIFTDTSAGEYFQALNGTFDWSEGFAFALLDASATSSTTVQRATLKFDMISATGAVFKGTVTCTTPQQ